MVGREHLVEELGLVVGKVPIDRLITLIMHDRPE